MAKALNVLTVTNTPALFAHHPIAIPVPVHTNLPKAPLAKTNMKAVTARITVLGQTVPALATQTTNILVREQTKQNHLHLFPAAENMLPVAAFLPTLGLTDNVLICVLLVTKVAKTEIRCSHGEAKQAS